MEVMGFKEVEGFEIDPPGDLGGGRRLLNIPPFYLPILFVWVISLSEVSGRKEGQRGFVFLLLHLSALVHSLVRFSKWRVSNSLYPQMHAR